MPYFFLETRTLAFVLMAVSILVSFIMSFIWRTRQTYPGFGLWAASSLSYAAGFLLLMLRGLLPDFVSILVANAFLLAAPLFILEGIRRFHGVVGCRLFSVTVLITLVALISYFLYVNKSLENRIIIYSLLAALVYFRCALELLRARPGELRPTSWLASGLFTIHGLILVSRAVFTFFQPDLNDLFARTELQTIVFTAPLLLGIAWTFSFVLLNSERLEMELKNAQVELQCLADTDFLTGIPNSRRFLEIGESEFKRARRHQHPLTVLMLDIDHFKHINDTYGHATGDQVLAAVALLCRRNLREVDTFGRMGGDEFVALLPETDHLGGLNVAERLRAALGEAGTEKAASSLHVTASLGLSVILPEDGRIEAALHRADSALYEAKRSGRNRVSSVFYQFDNKHIP